VERKNRDKEDEKKGGNRCKKEMKKGKERGKRIILSLSCRIRTYFV
jgi:hypothetical protein